LIRFHFQLKLQIGTSGKQVNNRSEEVIKRGGERIMEPMTEHPQRRYNAKMSSDGHSTVSSIKPKS
jgi:hypothetical protein